MLTIINLTSKQDFASTILFIRWLKFFLASDSLSFVVFNQIYVSSNYNSEQSLIFPPLQIISTLSTLVLLHPLTCYPLRTNSKQYCIPLSLFCLSRSDIKKRARVQNTICRYQMSCYLWVQEELEGRPCDPWLASARTTHPTRNNGRDCPAPLSAREVMQTPLQRRLLWAFAALFSRLVP